MLKGSVAMKDYLERIQKAKKLINDADYIIIGAGAGLSAAAGFNYDGERFERYFCEFKNKYGISDMYSGSFYNFESEEESWAYWAKMIECNSYDTKPTKLYQTILELVKEKKYFVVTTNTDNQFYINNFNMNKYFEIQGNYIYIQCKKGCHNKVYYNHDLIKQMTSQTTDCRIPTTLIPKCPVCSGQMDVHVRKNNNFVETSTWHKYSLKYSRFLKEALKHKVVFLEFGIGFNTPEIIRYPFEQMVYQYPNSNLIRFNKDYSFCLKGNENNVVSFNEDSLETIQQIITNINLTQ